MKVLLFQARDEGDPMREHEELCFRAKLQRFEGHSKLSLTAWNLVTEPPRAQTVWAEHDVILVGGSGRYGCVENSLPWFVSFLHTLRAIVGSRRPMFCSCFGHQALAVALGGKVIVDRANAELGTHVVSLNDAGRADPLYHGIQDSFTAQLGHNDRVVEPPAEATVLAFSPLCPIQSYRLTDAPVYATQFHPELDHRENQERAMGYLQVYDVEMTRPERLAQMFRPSDEASDLLARFFRLVLATDKGSLSVGATPRVAPTQS